MNTDMNVVYNADISCQRDFREQRKVLQVEPNTNMNDAYADLLSYHRDIGEQRREMQEANTLSDLDVVYAHLCRHRDLEEQRRKMPTPSDLLIKALAAIHTASATITSDSSPSNKHNPMHNNNIRSSSALLLSSSRDFQQHLQQLQQQQQMKHELHQLQKRQQELVQMMSTNTTTMSMPMSQNQQVREQQQQQQQLQSSPAVATATITPPITQKKTVNLSKTNFTVNLTEEAEEPTRTVDTTTTTVPSELDILIGRGRSIDNHQGNIYYRQVVESFRKEYETIAQKGDKTKFIRDVVDIIYENGHQFVKKVKDPKPRHSDATTTSSTCTCTWVPVARHVARDKVSNSFRNAKRLHTASVSANSASINNM